ncbi:MAG: hypothetical protein D8M56_19420 [Chloroflexi bacterium]|nr:hypothetical protein [Chloroflexota bacterium]
MQNSAIIRFGEEDIFNYFYYGPLALGSHWEIGDYSVNFDSVGRYSVSIPVKYVFMCTPDTGLDETGCAEYFANEMGWEMPNCTAEWLVILDTQEIVQMNDCADILFDQLPSN